MKKKNGASEKKENALESAREALDRAGETEERTADAVEVEAASAPDSTADAAPSAKEADAPAPVTPDSQTDTDTEPPATETAEPESSAPETSDDGGEADPSDEEPQAAAGDAADRRSPESTQSTMQTREITLGYHPSESDEEEEDAELEELSGEDMKSRGSFVSQLKEILRGRTDHRERAEHRDRSEGIQSSGSARDAAIRKRVMRIEDLETRNYLLDRVLPQMAWYGKRSEQYRTMYYRLMAVAIVLGALIPVFSLGANSNVVKVIIALLGASVTALNAYLALHNFRDLWLTYQTTREDLIHTLYCYFNRAGVFSQKKMTPEDLDVLLVDVCEDTLSKENGGWMTIVQKT